MNQKQTIGQIVADNVRTASIFQKHGLDFCCGGGKTVVAACEENGTDIQQILKEIAEITGLSEASIDYQSMALDELIDFIYNKHHKYIYENGPVTDEFINKVAQVHGDRHPEVIEIAPLYKELLADLDQHLMKEEQILFPYIKKMVQENDESNNENYGMGAFIEGPISVMVSEHDHAGDILKKMNELSGGYEPPTDACNTYRAAYAHLKALENDIHLHIHVDTHGHSPWNSALRAY